MMGAAVSEKKDDVEGYLLKIIREIVGNKIPLLLTLDHYGNLTEQMVKLADIIVSYETQPHKPYGTGKGGQLIFLTTKK